MGNTPSSHEGASAQRSGKRTSESAHVRPDLGNADATRSNFAPPATGSVAPDATDAEIKKAYKKQSLANHPDKNPGDENAQVRFQEVSAAYETLSDPDERAAYDRYGEGGDPRGGAPDMDDIFGMFCG